MPRKKKTTVEELIPDVGELDEREVMPEEYPSAIERVMEELGTDVTRVTLERVNDRGKRVYVGAIDAAEFSLDEVGARFGGGRYLARFRGPTGILKGAMFSLDAAIKPTLRTDDRGLGSASRNGDDGFQRDLLLALIKDRQPAPQTNLAEMIAAMSGIATAQAQAMMTAMTPLLAKITEMASSGGKATPMADLLAAIEVGSSMGGKDTSYLDVAKELGVPLIRAMEAALAKQHGHPVQLLPAQPGAAPAAAVPPADARPPWVQAFAPHVPKLVDFAVHGGDPGTVAAIVYQHNPPLARWLEDAVEHPQFVDGLVAQFPVLAPHKVWVAALCDEFKDDDALSGEPGETTEQGE